MSLEVSLKKIYGLKGKGQKLSKITFRNTTRSSKVVEIVENEAAINQIFNWSLTSKIKETETLYISVFSYNKTFSDRLVGKFEMVMQQVIKNGKVSLTENLEGNNNTSTKVSIVMEVSYQEPKDLSCDKRCECDDKMGICGKRKFSNIVASKSTPIDIGDERPRSQSLATTMGLKIKPITDCPGYNSKGRPRKGFGVSFPTDQLSSLKVENLSTHTRNEKKSVISKRSKPRIKCECRNAVPHNFQVSIKVIEARELIGSNINPVVMVQVGDEKKYTTQKESTTTPYYNEVFVFNFFVPAKALFDEILTLSVLHSRNIIRSGELLGSFKIALGAIYGHPHHNFYHKWALLTHPLEITATPKGYLKVDVSALGKGDMVKISKISDDDENVFDKNLLLPEGVPQERQKAKFVFKVYRADGLPKMNTKITEKLKTVFQGESRDLVDPYVEIDFCGQKAQTSVQKNSYSPCWNEKLTFTELFPPLCERVKVQIRDKDNIKNTVIGTAYIELDKISNSADKGFLPTFGPTFMNMYGSPRNYAMINEHSTLNEGLGEGVALRARLLLSLGVEMIDMNDNDVEGPLSTEPEMEKIPPLSEHSIGRPKDYFLFASFLEANMIDKRLADKPIRFEVSIGNCGNEIDGQSSKSSRNNASQNSTDESFGIDGFLQKLQHFMETGDMPLTHPVKPATTDGSYFYLPFMEEKPCVYLTSKWTDEIDRLHRSNAIHKIADKLEEGIDVVEDLIKSGKENPEVRLKEVFNDLAQGCFKYCRLMNNVDLTSSGKTKLDYERHNLCWKEIQAICKEAIKVKDQFKLSLLNDKILMLKLSLKKLIYLADDPQNGIPDLIIWMMSGKKRLAYARMPVREILHSENKLESGIYNGRIQTVFFRLPGKKSWGTSGWIVQAKVDVYIWFGLSIHKRNYMRGLPDGYEAIAARSKDGPPKALVYKDRPHFELRAHMYQARGLLAADHSGLSDPFAKVIMSTSTHTTKVISNTLNPTWDQTLILPHVTLFGRTEELRDDPPVVIIEVFDKDLVGKDEFIGRAIARPVVKMINEEYEAPRFPVKLDWFQVFRGAGKAGEILGAFELLQIDADCKHESENTTVVDGAQTSNVLAVPQEIRPRLVKHKIEVLFWGLRNLKRIQLTSVDRPRVDIEIAGRTVSSGVIANYKKKPNFSDPVKYIDELDLPEVEYWCPPICITVIDCRAFCRTILVGTHIVSNLTRFMHRPHIENKQVKKKNSSIGLARSLDTSKGTSSIISQLAEVKIDMENEEEENQIDGSALDWWSKYFASLDTFIEAQTKTEISTPITDREVEGEKEEVDEKENEFNQVDPDVKIRKNLMQGALDAVKQAKWSFADVGKQNKGGKLPIDEFKIYDTELENVPEFSGFNDLLSSFDLYRGKRIGEVDDSEDQKRVVGVFKGGFKISRQLHPVKKKSSRRHHDKEIEHFKGIPSNNVLGVLVRVYVVRATDLHPTDPNGKADPYVVLSLGGKKVNDKDHYISKQLNPIFGRTFEIEAKFPLESVLTLQIFDWDLLSGDDLIGETKIDLENRFYSKHRPTCGIAEKYSLLGYNQWRDPMKPSQILRKLCKNLNLDGPYFGRGSVRIGRKTFYGSVTLEDKNGERYHTDEHVALVALRRWDEIPNGGCKLVPEHVETRSLFHPEKPGIEQGRVEMWVDMFPMDQTIPGPAVDIAPRKPKGYQLRVVIWNTDSVVLQDDNIFTGEKSSDIYVKGWLLGDDKQETDIHYRSFTGEGNFNWRFIFPFDYMMAEEKIVVSKKENVFAWDKTEFKIPPRLHLQVWDADHFSSDDFLGSLTLDLTRMPRGARTAAKCSLKLAQDEEKELEIPTISLFKLRRLKGWWPFTNRNDKHELEITGKLEAEFSLLSFDEAEKDPAGYARDEPDPLEKPNRPDTSFTWFMNPLHSFRYLFCSRFKWVITKVSILFLLIMIVVLLIYSSPSWIMKKAIGA